MLIRQNAPGKPITYIDLGWARGRSSTHPFQSMGGPITDTAKPFKPDRRLNETIDAEKKNGLRVHGERRKYARCGFIMPLASEPCARRVGHVVDGIGRGHKTHGAMERDNARRRARDFGA